MYSWKLNDVPGDGNCLFSAIGRSLQKPASELRSIAVHWASQPGQTMNGNLVKDWIQWNFNMPPEVYLSMLEKNGFWGGANEMSILANALSIAIIVFEKSGVHTAKKKYEFFPDLKTPETRAVCVLYTGGNHYMQISLQRNP
jgi:hypothetical protein